MDSKQVLISLAVMLISMASNGLYASHYDQGVSAFKAGHYQQAVALFSRVLNGTPNAELVHYNLGTSYYKLGEYERALSHFRLASKKPALAGLAYYNLGLTSVRLAELSQAKQYFRLAHRKTESRQIQALAKRQLDKFDDRSGVKRNRTGKFSSYISLNYNYDDNVTNANDDIITETIESDEYVDLFAYIKYKAPFGESAANSVKLGGYVSRYDNLTTQDQTQINLSFSHYRVIGDWRSRFSVQAYRDEIGMTDFQQRYNYQLRGDLLYRKSQRLRLQYDYTEIDHLDELYRPLSGDRHRLKIENRSRFAKGRSALLGYRFEYNQRNDQRTVTSFTSYSPSRHSVYLRFKEKLSPKLKMKMYLGYRVSDYRVGNQVNSQTLAVREDKRLRATLQLNRAINNHVDLALKYRYTRNTSNYVSKAYKSNYFGLALILYAF